MRRWQVGALPATKKCYRVESRHGALTCLNHAEQHTALAAKLGQRITTVSHSAPTSLFPPLPGASVAINGTCLTVTEQRGPVLRFDVMAETLRRTNLGTLDVGSPVNFERRSASASTLPCCCTMQLLIGAALGRPASTLPWGSPGLRANGALLYSASHFRLLAPTRAARAWVTRLAGTRCRATCTPPPRSSR